MSEHFLIDHLHYNIQMCPYCEKQYKEAIMWYNVIWKCRLCPFLDLWQCRRCKNYIILPNLYEVSVRKL